MFAFCFKGLYGPVGKSGKPALPTRRRADMAIMAGNIAEIEKWIRQLECRKRAGKDNPVQR